MFGFLYGSFGLAAIVFLIVLVIISILIPFFILRIRNESIETNRLLCIVISRLSDQGKGVNFCEQNSAVSCPGEMGAVVMPNEENPERTFSYKAGRLWKKFTDKYWWPGH